MAQSTNGSSMNPCSPIRIRMDVEICNALVLIAVDEWLSAETRNQLPDPEKSRPPPSARWVSLGGVIPSAAIVRDMRIVNMRLPRIY